MTLQQWIVQAVSIGIIGTLAFLAKNSMKAILDSLSLVNTKLDELSKSFGELKGDTRVLEADIRALSKRVDALESVIQKTLGHSHTP